MRKCKPYESNLGLTTMGFVADNIQVYSASGNLIEVLSPTFEALKIKTDSWPVGMYYLYIVSKNKAKFISAVKI